MSTYIKSQNGSITFGWSVFGLNGTRTQFGNNAFPSLQTDCAGSQTDRTINADFWTNTDLGSRHKGIRTRVLMKNSRLVSLATDRQGTFLLFVQLAATGQTTDADADYENDQLGWILISHSLGQTHAKL